MPRFSANLGFLWPELDLCDSIRAASQAGFDAVECHWPYDVPPENVVAQLADAAISMLTLNTRPGNLDADEFGVAALPGRQHQAREYIDEALDYAAQIQCPNIHVMAGKTYENADAQSIYIENLIYACNHAAKFGITVLVEPINTRDVPGYHLNSVDCAVQTLAKVNQSNLKIMFDCYHVQIMQGDIINRIKDCFNQIGHLQIASVPDRAEPDKGELDYATVISALDEMGYHGFLGAEYKPSGNTADHLGWLDVFKS